MSAFGTPRRYGTVAQFLHWTTAILVVAAFTYGPGGSEERVYSTAKDFDRQIHETLGLAVFSIALIRLLWRAFDVTPDEPPTPRWMSVAAKTVHGTLYALLLTLPITAISGAWFEAHPLTLPGGIRIGPWLPEMHALGKSVASIHTWLGDAILWVAGAHAAAALYHHFVLRDRALKSMLPGGA